MWIPKFLGGNEHSVILDTCGSQLSSVMWIMIFSGQHQFPDRNNESNKNKPFISFAKTQHAIDVRPYLKYLSEMKFHSKLFLMSLWRQCWSKISSQLSLWNVGNKNRTITKGAKYLHQVTTQHVYPPPPPLLLTFLATGLICVPSYSNEPITKTPLLLFRTS